MNRTVTNYNAATMQKIVSVMECIPDKCALRGEPIVSIEMDGDEIVAINFPVMRMRRVTQEWRGWAVESFSAIFLEK